MASEAEHLPQFIPGHVVRNTPNYQVVTDYKPGMEGNPKGWRFYIVPKTDDAERMLHQAADVHNIHNFVPRQVVDADKTVERQALRADFIEENLQPLFQGKTEKPGEGEDTIPSPDRLEDCLRDHPDHYSFSD